MSETPVSLLLQFQQPQRYLFEEWCDENNPTLEEMIAEMERRLPSPSLPSEDTVIP